LVSATPHSGDRAAFEYLISMGTAGDPMAIFRRRRGDVGLAVSAARMCLRVRPTDEETALMAGIERYARANLDRARACRPHRPPNRHDDGAAGGIVGGGDHAHPPSPACPAV
jgi:hypothetical protein